MNDLEGEVTDEKVQEGTLGNDILTADLDGENIRIYRSFGVANNSGYLICRECVGKVPEALFNVRSEFVLALVRYGDIFSIR